MGQNTTSPHSVTFLAMKKVPFSDPLSILNFVGMNFTKTSKFSKILEIFFVFIHVLVCVLVFLEMILHSNGLETFSRGSESLFPSYQLTWKMFLLMAQKDRLLKIIEDAEQFWPLDMFGVHLRIVQTNIFLHRIMKKFFLTYRVVVYVAATQYTLTPIIFRSNKPLLLCYGENEEHDYPYQELVFILHFVGMFFASTISIGFDCLFFYIITHILTELRMVKVAFGDYEIKPKWSKEERFKKAVQHHVFILDFIKDVNDTFSLILLNLKVSHLFVMCFGLLMMAKDGMPPDFDHLSKYLPYLNFFVVQLFVICIAGDLILQWSLEIPDAIFYQECKDGEVSPKNCAGVVLAIYRSQRAARLELCGFGHLDLNCFTAVMKDAFSFFTFVNTMMAQK